MSSTKWKEVFEEARHFDKWQNECPWEIAQWDSFDFGWKGEMFYKN